MSIISISTNHDIEGQSQKKDNFSHVYDIDLVHSLRQVRQLRGVYANIVNEVGVISIYREIDIGFRPVEEITRSVVLALLTVFLY